MLNEYSLLQITLLSILFFLYWTNDIFNVIILSVVYLLILSIITLYLESDIFISFLIIIDLGVFLVLFAFLLHLSKFLTYKNLSDSTFKNLLILSFLATYLSIYNYFINFAIMYNYNKVIEYTWVFFISYLDYYNLNSTVINSDMHLLKEVYFHVNSLEFLLISIFLVIGILVLYFLLNFILKYELSGSNYLNKNFKLKNKNNSFFFFKIQNFNKQINTSASSRVWVKFKNDTKTNNIISNR